MKHPKLNIAIEAARHAGLLIQHAARDLNKINVSQKGLNDFVTDVDKNAEGIVLEKITKAFPQDSITAEESGMKEGSSSNRWFIDPLDGTSNFIHGFPYYCVSIALYESNTPALAVIYDPNQDELFTAVSGQGAAVNDRRIRMNKDTALRNAMTATGFPFRGDDNFSNYMQLFEKITRSCAAVRRPGAAALDLANVAAGRFDAFFEQGLRSWDCAAGALLVREAGGLVGNYQGNEFNVNASEVLAASPKTFSEMVKILKPHSLCAK